MKEINIKILKIVCLSIFLLIPIPSGTITLNIGITMIGSFFSITAEILNEGFNIYFIKEITILITLIIGVYFSIKKSNRLSFLGFIFCYISLFLMIKFSYFKNYYFSLMTTLYFFISLYTINQIRISNKNIK